MSYSFEDKLDIILKEIENYRKRWDNIKIDPSIDFEDMSQIVLIHIYNKWSFLNQEGVVLQDSLKKVIRNQFFGLVRYEGYKMRH